MKQSKIDILKKNGKYLEYFKKIEGSKSKEDVEAKKNLAAHLMLGERYHDALQVFSDIVQCGAHDNDTLINFSACLLRCDLYDHAGIILNEIIESDPNNRNALINLCTVYQVKGDFQKQAECALKAIALDPTCKVSYNNLGSALAELLQYEGALEAFDIASTIDPSYFPSLMNKAQLQAKLNRPHDAIAIYDKILKLKSTSRVQAIQTNYFKAYACLEIGDLQKGWELYDFGLEDYMPMGSKRTDRVFNKPKWRGEDLSKKTVMVWREQGVGDTLLFLQCLENIIKLANRVIFESDPRLISLIQRTFPEIEVCKEGERDDYHYQISIASLPRFFRYKDEHFGAHRTFNVDTKRQEDIKKILASKINNDNPKVGICWRSGKLSVSRNLHYTALSDWLKFFQKNQNLNFVNLQYDDCKQEIDLINKGYGVEIINLDHIDLKNDFESTAALIANLDIVVTVNTSVLSMSFMTGVKTHLITKRSWDFLGKNSFPWSPNVTLHMEPEITKGLGSLLDNLVL